MNPVNVRLSRRDHSLLKLAFDVSVTLKQSGYISELLLRRIFAQFIYTSPTRAILNLRRMGLITQGQLAGHVQIQDVRHIKQRDLFGEDDIRFSQDAVSMIVERWQDNEDNLFDSGTIDETGLDQVPDSPPTPATSKKRKPKTSDDVLLDGVDVPQIMTNIIHVHGLLGKPIPSWACYSIVENDCPEGINPTSVRAALNRKGYTAFQTGVGSYTWYPTEAGREIAENDVAEPSLSEKDLQSFLH